MSVRVEVWNRGNTARLAVLQGVVAANRTRSIGREETLELRVAESDPGLSLLERAAILRLQTEGSGSDFTLWRVVRQGWVLESSGQRVRQISAHALWMDLRHGRVRQEQADGTVLFGFGLAGLTPEQWLSEIILPGYDGDAIAAAAGVIELLDAVDLTFDSSSPLDALRMLEQASGGELQWRYSGTGLTVFVDLLERVGQSQGGARLRYGHNIRGLRRFDDDTQAISRIYAQGSGLLTLADALWPVTGVSGTSGARVLSFQKSPVFEDGAFVGLYLMIRGGAYPITASSRDDGTITVDEGSESTLIVGDVARIAVHPVGTALPYLESPLARSQVGVRTGELEGADDVPDAVNLLANGDFSDWALLGDAPESWTPLGAPTITRVDSPLYGKHGGVAARVEASVAEAGLISAAVDVPQGNDRRPYLGMLAGLTVASGSVRIELRHSDGTIYPVQERPGSEGLGVYLTLSAGPVHDEPLPAGTVQMAIVAHGGAADFYVDCAMLTPQVGSEVPEFVRDQGAWVLWDRAVFDLQARSAEVREYDVEVADLHRIDPDAFPFHELRLGDDVRVWDPEFGEDTLRIVEISHDPLRPEDTRVAIAPGPWQRPPKATKDLFRPRYQPRRPSFGKSGPGSPVDILHHHAYHDSVEGEVIVSAVGTPRVATLQLYTKATPGASYPSSPTATINGRSGTFPGVSGSHLYYRIVALDGRGVAGGSAEDFFGSVQSFSAEYASDDQGSNASTTFNPAVHRYARHSTNGGQTWTDWFLIVGEDGASSEGRYTDYIFRTAETQPATPTGTSPSGWFDAPPAYDPSVTSLWFSRAERDGATNALLSTWSVPVRLTGATGPQGDDGDPGPPGPPGASMEVRYSGPAAGANISTTFNPTLHLFFQARISNGSWPVNWARMVGEDGVAGEDGLYFDYRFRTSSSEPLTPTGVNPTGWFDAPPPYDPAVTNLWMTRAQKDARDGSLLSTWSTPVRLTGDRGAPGIDGSDGVNGDDGTSIVWRGTFASHPSSPQNGWAYRNSSDGRSYVYQSGTWYQMTVDGVDGQAGSSTEVRYSGPTAGANISTTFNSAQHLFMQVRQSTSPWPSAWARIVGEAGAPGTDGRYTDYIFRCAATQPATPSGTSPSGWSDAPTQCSGDLAVWMSTAERQASGALIGSWSTPIRLTGQQGLSISYRGEFASPPASPQVNWVYRDTDNGRIYIWTGTAWELMVLDGSDGADGTDGDDGLSVFITYHDNPPSAPPATPTGSGTSDGWSTVARSSARWMSQKVAASASSGTWGAPILIRGAETGRILNETFSEIPRGMSATSGVSIVEVPGAAGGRVMQVSGVSRQWVPLLSEAAIPFDAQTLYRVEVRTRVVSDDSSGTNMRFYAGIRARDGAGNALGPIAGNHYVAAGGPRPTAADGWVTYVGWLRGLGGSSQGQASDPENPAALIPEAADCAYISPIIYINYTGATDQVTQVDYFRIEAVSTELYDLAEQAAADAIALAAGAQATADGKVTTYFQAGPPSGASLGDLWIETDQDNRLHRHNGSGWVLVRDQGIADAINAAADAQETADGKITTFYSPTQPTAEGVGDLWVETDDQNHLRRWNGSSWVSMRDGTISVAIAAAAAASDAAADALAASASAQAAADGKIQTFYQGTPPTAEGEGDLWINTAQSNTLYRWNGLTWIAARDGGIAQAISSAAGAQATADGKVTTFYQTSAPTAEGVGDLWVDTDDYNHPYRWNGSDWVSVRDGTIDRQMMLETFPALPPGMSGVTGTAIVPVDGAAGGTVLQVTGIYRYWYPAMARAIPFDPTTLYRLEVRVRVTVDDADGVNGLFYAGVQARDAAGGQLGGNIYLAASARRVTVADGWVTYVGWLRGTAAGHGNASNPLNPSGVGSALASFISPLLLINYPTPSSSVEQVTQVDYFRIEPVATELYDLVEQAAADAVSLAAGAQATADGKVTTFFQAGVPSSPSLGDLWIETDQGNRLRRWNGSSWAIVQDAGIAEAINAAADAQETADGKIVTFYQAGPPSSAVSSLGDIWIETDNNNHPWRWNGSSWVSIRDGQISIALDNAASAASAAASALAAAQDAQATADGKIRTFYQPNMPWGPASSVGDLWIETDRDNLLYRYDGTTWIPAQDGLIGQAITDAAGAQATADGKVTTFYSTSPPTAEGIGDLWVDTNDNNHLYRWNGSSWISVRDTVTRRRYDTIRIPFTGFTPANDQTEYQSTSISKTTRTDTIWTDLQAPLYVPEGAVITRFSARLYQSALGGFNTANVNLRRVTDAGVPAPVGGTLVHAGAAAGTWHTDTEFVNEAVGANSYFFTVGLRCSAGAVSAIMWAELEYYVDNF